MKKLLAILLLLPSIAFAQNPPVIQSGQITPGHAVQWITNGVIGDGGVPGGPIFTGSTTVNDFACVGMSGTIIDCGLSVVGTNGWTGLQNFNGGATAPTRAPGDSTTNVATTAFVNSAVSSNLVIGTSAITSGTSNGLLYDNAGVLGNLATGNNGLLITNGSGVPAIGNTLQGDLYFGSGRPWCDIRAEGAKQDGSTDDYTAWQACNTNLTALGGGKILVPPSTNLSCIKSSTFTPGNGVVIEGVSNGYGENVANNPPSGISACGVDHTLLNFVNVANGMRGMFVRGADFGTQPAVTINATRLLLEDNTFRGGAPPVKIVAGAAQVDNVYNYNRFGASYGTANILIQNIAFYGYRNIFNTAYNGNAPGTGTISTISAWAATTAYVAGNIVSAVGPDSNTYYIKVTPTGGGTSGGSQPTLTGYDTTFTDGSVTWSLLRPAGAGGVFYDIQCDTGCSNIFDISGDHSGAAIGIGFTNSLSGTAPNTNVIINGFFGNDWGGDIVASAGYGLQVIGGIHTACVTTACKEIAIASTYGGDVLVDGTVMGGAATGIDIAAGGNIAVKNAQIFGMTTAAVNIAANINGVSVVANDIGSDTNSGANANAVTVQPGTGDYLTIANNNTEGATAGITTTSVTGTHNVFTPNSGWTTRGIDGLVSLGIGSANATGTGLFIQSGAPALSGNSQGALGTSGVNGLVIRGQGSTSDLTLQNKSLAAVATIPTGTTTMQFTGSVLSSGPTSGVGYSTGAGGTVTQATSRTTGVTLNTVSGAITMFSAAGSTTAATFTVTDSAVSATDVIHLAQKSGTNLYNLAVTAVAAGSFNVTFFTTGGTATDAPVINFAVIKGVAN